MSRCRSREAWAVTCLWVAPPRPFSARRWRRAFFINDILTLLMDRAFEAWKFPYGTTWLEVYDD